MYDASYQTARKQNTEQWQSNYQSGIPSLSNTTSPDENDQPMFLVGCCMPQRRLGGTKAAMGQRRPPWSWSMVKKSICRLILVVFCV